MTFSQQDNAERVGLLVIRTIVGKVIGWPADIPIKGELSREEEVELSPERQQQILEEELQKLTEEEYRSKVRDELRSKQPTSRESTPVDRPRESTHLLRRSLLGVFFIGVIIYVLGHISLPTQGTPKTGSLPSLLRPFSQPLLQGSVDVPPLRYHYWKFEVSDTMLNARVIGPFHASGGFGNDIEAVLAEWSQCENWMNGHQARVLYQSGKVTNGVLDTPVPQAGTYCLAFSNTMGLISSKTVSGDVALRYLAP